MPSVQTHSSRWWIAPVIGLIVLFTAGAGLAAHSYYSASGTGTGTTGSGTTTTNSSGPTSAASAGASSGDITLAEDAFAYPGATQVANTFNAYFGGINDHQYARWRSAVTAAVANEPGSSETQWRVNFSTTSDTQIKLYRIDTTANGQLQVLTTFTSHQDARYSPDHKSTCDNWRMVYVLTPVKSGYLVAGANVLYTACS